ncbi:MAG: hypothetical protein JWO15_3730 [Sphingomonadales bacterium]|nr:hypothetical protein [Sphingomonadales bacterium]
MSAREIIYAWAVEHSRAGGANDMLVANYVLDTLRDVTAPTSSDPLVAKVQEAAAALTVPVTCGWDVLPGALASHERARRVLADAAPALADRVEAQAEQITALTAERDISRRLVQRVTADHLGMLHSARRRAHTAEAEWDAAQARLAAVLALLRAAQWSPVRGWSLNPADLIRAATGDTE